MSVPTQGIIKTAGFVLVSLDFPPNKKTRLCACVCVCVCHKICLGSGGNSTRKRKADRTNPTKNPHEWNPELAAIGKNAPGGWEVGNEIGDFLKGKQQLEGCSWGSLIP